MLCLLALTGWLALAGTAVGQALPGDSVPGVQIDSTVHPPLNTFYLTAPRCDSLLVENIVLAGNRVTRRPIIQRELDFRQGSRIAIADTAAFLANARNRLYNTRLFVTVSIKLVSSNYDTTLCPRPVFAILEFKERWYIFPVPILELSDRSINEWIYNQGADLRRINYGARVEWNNFRGRAESVKLILQGGFTRKLELAYAIPYIGRKQRQGMAINLFHDSNRSISVASAGNKQKFIRDGASNIVWRYRAGIGTSFRSGFYQYHATGLNYYYSRVADTVVKANKDYFYKGLNHQSYFTVHYQYSLDRRDIRQYPLHGGYFRTGYDQYVFTNNGYLSSLFAEGGKFFELGHGFFTAHGSSFTVSSPKRQPYSLTRFLGFQQHFVRGYEKYVLEGYANAVLKNTVRYRLFKNTVHLRYMPIRQFSTIPIALYVKGYSDIGYVRNPFAAPENARLLNTFLWGFGGGLDLVTYYDYVLRMEYSLNRQGESGFYLQMAVEI